MWLTNSEIVNEYKIFYDDLKSNRKKNSSTNPCVLYLSRGSSNVITCYLLEKYCNITKQSSFFQKKKKNKVVVHSTYLGFEK